MDVERINFHHLRYFWAVAKEGNLTRTAARLRVAQSALSTQIKQLEDSLGAPLFLRTGRKLSLTEAGKIALAYAEQIFSAGSELVSTLERGRHVSHVLRVGAAATLSRNFQESFIKPLLGQPGLCLRLESGVLGDLLARLEAHDVDLVLTNRRPPRLTGHRFSCRRIARQPVSIVGKRRRKRFGFPADLAGVPVILPGPESDIRSEFDAICERLGVRLQVFAEVDDMATMRLLARDTDALALLPSVVVRDELRDGVLHEHGVVPGLFETFYAVTAERSYPHPLLKPLLARGEDELLATQPRPRGVQPQTRR